MVRAQSAAGPRIELSAAEWSFGKVWQGTPLSHDVVVRNVGDAPLEIIDVKSSCGCTVATNPKSPLGPGESDVMKITFDSVKRRERQTQTITLVTNDPAQPNVMFRVNGYVKPVYDMKSAKGNRYVNSISFGRLFQNTSETRALEILNRYTAPLKLKLKEGQDFGAYDITLESIEPGAHYRLAATPRLPLRVGEARGSAILETGVDILPEIRVLIYGSVQPPISVTPRKLKLPRQSVMVIKRTLQVWRAPGSDVKVLSVKANHDSIKTELQDTDPDPGKPDKAPQVIVIELPPADQIPDGLKPTIEIRTNAEEADYQKLIVPVQLIGTRDARES